MKTNKKLARKKDGDVIRVGLHMPAVFWKREAQTLANMMSEGNKSLMVRQLIELELNRRIRHQESKLRTGYAGQFLRE